MRLFDLTGKVALVTGGNGGIGLAMAQGMASCGASIVIAGRNAEKAGPALASLRELGAGCAFVAGDVTKKAACVKLVADTVAEFGRLDILVNNAGMFMYKPLAETTEEEFDRMFSLNTKGPYFALQEAAKVIRDGGRIVNISTDGTHIGFGGATAYLGSKGALEQFTKGLAHELAPKEVTVNTVSPGYTVTAMLPADSAFRQIGEQASPLKRLGTPKDIADVVAFVVSEEARWLTGQNLHAGGGVVM